jgi:hypothetical protein
VVEDSALAQRLVGKNTRASASLGRGLAIANLALVALSSSLAYPPLLPSLAGLSLIEKIPHAS